MAESEARSLLAELKGLADTLGIEIAGMELVKVRESTAALGMGAGKAQEVADLAQSLEVECLIFDRDLSPTQQRNWEQLTERSCLDRQEVILRIFSMRAQTREARLQIELAELKHALPRLAHKYIDLNRQRGGRYGTKGSGEKKLELDRRGIQNRIDRLKEELRGVEAVRQTQRKRREKTPVPSCALVGYTNAGKSSLLNAMTNADTLVEDKLFATLDPTTRRMERADGSAILLTDTVGFIRRLPHDLVNAFRSTLEEATLADLVLIVLDASDPEVIEQHRTTIQVLDELGAGDKPRLIVLNKIDRVDHPDIFEGLAFRFKDAIRISARTGDGLEELSQRIDSILGGSVSRICFPADQHDLAALVHRTGSAVEEEYTDDAIRMKARLPERVRGQLREWLEEE